MDLVSLIEELKRQKLTSFDIIGEDEDITAFSKEDLGILLGVYNSGMRPPILQVKPYIVLLSAHRSRLKRVIGKLVANLPELCS